jgi:hypothetical protein
VIVRRQEHVKLRVEALEEREPANRDAVAAVDHENWTALPHLEDVDTQRRLPNVDEARCGGDRGGPQ